MFTNIPLWSICALYLLTSKEMPYATLNKLGVSNIAFFPLFRYLIFDEADRLVSGDGGQWMNSIVKRIQHLQADNDKGNVFGGLIMPGFTAPRSHFAHKLLISATLSCDAEKLNALNLYDPILFTTPASDPGKIACIALTTLLIGLVKLNLIIIACLIQLY